MDQNTDTDKVTTNDNRELAQMKLYIIPMVKRVVITKDHLQDSPAYGHVFPYLTKDCMPVAVLEEHRHEWPTDAETFGEPIPAPPGMVVQIAGWERKDHKPMLYVIDADGGAVQLGTSLDVEWRGRDDDTGRSEDAGRVAGQVPAS
jgi:hypothetical protein